jgi:hypothetical protein
VWRVTSPTNRHQPHTRPRPPTLPQGLRKDGPAILLVGGGEGMGALEATVRELDARLKGTAQIAVICGRNKRLLSTLRETVWPGGTHLVAVGFVDNVHEWMAACDTIITKAGPGTIAEALISGLPILLNGNVPCQVGLAGGFGALGLGAGGVCAFRSVSLSTTTQLKPPTHPTATPFAPPPIHPFFTGGGQHPVRRRQRRRRL